MKYWMALLLALVSFNTYAGLTKWVDSEGKVHYSDAPPPENVKSETLRGSPSQGAPAAASATPASGSGAPKTIYEMEADLKKERKAKEEAAQKAAKEQQEASQKQQACAQARDQLATLQNMPRIVTYDEKGGRSFMDDTTRQQRIEEAQASVGKYCQ